MTDQIDKNRDKVFDGRSKCHLVGLVKKNSDFGEANKYAIISPEGHCHQCASPISPNAHNYHIGMIEWIDRAWSLKLYEDIRCTHKFLNKIWECLYSREKETRRAHEALTQEQRDTF